MEKLNIAEILKDCPKGTKLYSPLCGECYFDRLNQGTIICKKQNTQEITFTSEGYYMLPIFNDCECMIFPSKENRDWSKFQRPFKDGDIITCTNYACSFVALFKRILDKTTFERYCLLLLDNGKFRTNVDFSDFIKPRFATEEEKQKLFDAIKANGYRWNAETKTLEKLIIPKFKVEDTIETLGYRYTIKEITDGYYLTLCGNKIRVDNQDKFTLVLDKFDISTLMPFDKVLVRSTNTDKWKISLFGYIVNEGKQYFICVGSSGFFQCIPYNEDTKHLVGTNNDCDEYYKTW